MSAIKASPVWTKGKTAIVIVWDENDYSQAPVTNQVVLIVDRNYGHQGVQSTQLLYAFLSAEDGGNRARAALPQPRLRLQHGCHV